MELAYCFAHSSPFSVKADGKATTGFILPISANTGIGSGLSFAKRYKAVPPLILPVKPIPFTAGCIIKCCPTSMPLLFKLEKTPLGIPVCSAALIIAEATNSPVPACIGWLFTITGQPAASALAVSPPAVENAKGKLLAPKTTIGPMGHNILRRSTFGIGWRSGCAGSMVASTHEPSSNNAAKAFN